MSWPSTVASDAALAPTGRRIPRLALAPVLSAMVALTVVLTATSGGYGYHRDELYFRMLHPAWGYVDQPPLTPLLAALTRLLADQPWAMRIPATLAAVVSVLVLALVTRELGGGRAAQALCAWGYAFASLVLVMGHVLLTSTVDLPVWPAVLLCLLRARLRDRPQWWVAAGLVVGLSMYNKLLVAVLLVSVAAGLLLVGPRRLLWSRWPLTGAAVALLVGAPNLVYQATHGWPQLSMGQALADHNGSDVRILMWPFLLLLLGPPLVPVWAAGLAALCRRPQWRPVRFVAAAFPALLALVWLMGTQVYYPLGLLAVLFAAGCVPVAAWMERAPWRRVLVVGGVALNALVSLLLGLPVIPVSVLGATPVPAVNQVARDSVGWPAYVRQVAAGYATVPPRDRARTVVVTSNYGEAGAVARYGAAYDLPAVYSGHNELYYRARPPAGATVVVFVGGQLAEARGLFGSCLVTGLLDNGRGVDNEEQGEPVAVCRDPVGGWRAVWPRLRHQD